MAAEYTKRTTVGRPTSGEGNTWNNQSPPSRTSVAPSSFTNTLNNSALSGSLSRSVPLPTTCIFMRTAVSASPPGDEQGGERAFGNPELAQIGEFVAFQHHRQRPLGIGHAEGHGRRHAAQRRGRASIAPPPNPCAANRAAARRVRVRAGRPPAPRRSRQAGGRFLTPQAPPTSLPPSALGRWYSSSTSVSPASPRWKRISQSPVLTLDRDQVGDGRAGGAHGGGGRGIESRNAHPQGFDGGVFDPIADVHPRQQLALADRGIMENPRRHPRDRAG